MKNDGTVPTVLVKESNESVDLMKQADEKLKQVLEMLVPSRRNSSVKSKTSSQRSKSSNYSIKNKLVQQAAVQVKQPVQVKAEKVETFKHEIVVEPEAKEAIIKAVSESMTPSRQNEAGAEQPKRGSQTSQLSVKSHVSEKPQTIVTKDELLVEEEDDFNDYKDDKEEEE